MSLFGGQGAPLGVMPAPSNRIATSISFVGFSTTHTLAAAPGPITVPVPAGSEPGDLLLFAILPAVSSGAGPGIIQSSPLQPPGPFLIGPGPVSSGSASTIRLQIMAHLLLASDGASFTFAYDSSDGFQVLGACVGYRGVDPCQPISTMIGGHATSADDFGTLNTPTLTTVAPNSYVVQFGGDVLLGAAPPAGPCSIAGITDRTGSYNGASSSKGLDIGDQFAAAIGTYGGNAYSDAGAAANAMSACTATVALQPVA